MSGQSQTTCPACPVEVRNLFAVAFNLLNLFEPCILAGLGVLCFISCASIHTAQGTFIAAHVADAVSTEHALATGRTEETNPLLQGPGRYAVKAAGVGMAVWASQWLNDHGHPRLAKTILYAGSGVTVGVAAHNWQVK